LIIISRTTHDTIMEEAPVAAIEVMPAPAVAADQFGGWRISFSL
jgi:hypothetical protein